MMQYCYKFRGIILRFRFFGFNSLSHFQNFQNQFFSFDMTKWFMKLYRENGKWKCKMENVSYPFGILFFFPYWCLLFSICERRVGHSFFIFSSLALAYWHTMQFWVFPLKSYFCVWIRVSWFLITLQKQFWSSILVFAFEGNVDQYNFCF